MSGFPSITTYSSLTDEIIANLRGYTAAPDQLTTLAAALTATTARVKVDDIQEISKGVIEIGSELIYVKSIDESTSEAITNTAWRGFRGTLAEAHVIGESVTYSPTFPRATVMREINNVLLSLYPMVFGVKTVEIVSKSGFAQYDLPAVAGRVMDVDIYWDSFIGWERLRHWEVRHSAGTSTTGVTLDLFGRIPTGRTIRVLYAVAPTALVNPVDVFTTVTGLPESAKDVVTFGVMWRLAQNLDLARLPVNTVEADMLGQNRTVGSAINVAQTFMKLHMQAMQRERTRLNESYPARIHLVK